MSGNQFIAHLFPKQMFVSHRERLLSGFGAILAIAATTWITHYYIGPVAAPFMLASMGASAVLLIGTPHSPLAQPWPVIGGHLISAVIGVTCARELDDVNLAAALAVGLSIFAMFYLRCLHPPGGATGLLAVIGDQHIHSLGYHFVVVPVMANILVLFAISLLVNKMIPGRSYPYRLSPPRADSSPLTGKLPLRLDFGEEDLIAVLRSIGSHIDVTFEDLETIYTRAITHAHRRQFGDTRVRDVMTRDVVSVQPETPLGTAWKLLQHHKIRGMPVTGKDRKVLGVLAIADFLKLQDWPAHACAALRRWPFRKRTDKLLAEQIMTSGPILGHEDMHLEDAFILFTQHHINHLPVVNAEGYLVGMLTRLDLLASSLRSHLASANLPRAAAAPA